MKAHLFTVISQQAGGLGISLDQPFNHQAPSGRCWQ